MHENNERERERDNKKVMNILSLSLDSLVCGLSTWHLHGWSSEKWNFSQSTGSLCVPCSVHCGYVQFAPFQCSHHPFAFEFKCFSHFKST